MRLPLLALGLGLFAGAADAAASPGVRLDARTQARLGVVVAPLVSSQRTPSATGQARALDVTPLASLDADLMAAVAAAGASRAEAERTQGLAAADATVSRKVAEAALAQARADASRVTLLRRRIGLEWGQAFASDSTRARLLEQLASGRAALVRIDTAADFAQVRSVRLNLGPSGWTSVRILGPARAADLRLQTPGFIGLVMGAQAIYLPVGASVPAALDLGQTNQGVVAPRAALIRAAGKTYVYVRTAPDQFERREVRAGLAQPDGVFVASGFSPGEPVVVSGAAALLAAEAAGAAPKAED